MKKRFLGVLLAVTMLMSGCAAEGVYTDGTPTMSEEDAKAEMSALMKKIDVTTTTNPAMDIYFDAAESVALADIDTFPITEDGNGQIDIEIAAATELSADAPDDWINVVAKNFNRAGYTIDGKSVSVSVRKITSGEAVTYINAGVYEPEVFIPSNYT